MLANNIKVNTRINYIYTLRTFFSIVDKKNLKDITRGDVETWVRHINEKYAPQTQDVFKISIKKFFQWVYGMDEGYPEPVKWLKRKRESNLPNEILTTQDVLNLIKAANTDRDRALIHVLYESAGRASEILDLKIKDVILDDYGASITVNGKTGMRRLRLIDSVPAITAWLNSHPLRDNPNAPLWHVHGYKKHSTGGLSYSSLESQLKTIKKRSDVKKPVNPHNFRHSRLTELAREGFIESELRIIAGWTPGSNMPAVYLHISGADIDKKMLSKAGILADDEEMKSDDVLRPIKCPRCKQKNPAGSKFCNCGMVLDSRAALNVEEAKLVIKAEDFKTMLAEMQAMRREMEDLKSKV
ncbi:tyrosine-type recombinase/integrase [Candidatus Pacearchaeota archaeon]|nr:tyrosine-type recombinase/integrase [Candidatus Pacearchaeota archaeon]